MTTDLIQTDYDQLTAIAHRFAQQAAAIEQMQSQLRQGLTPLQQGDWLGRGAAAFFAEMTQETLPAVGRLHAALAEAGRVTQEIIQMMQQAEEEAARPFQGASEAGSGGNQTPDQAATDPTAKPLSESNTAPLAGQLPARKSTQEIFSKSYMEKSIGSHYRGENSAELNRLMEDLVRARTTRSPEVDRILDRIADIRGVDRAAFHAQYQTYLDYMETAHAKRGDYPDIDLNRHGDFLGSTVSLRYGAVVGDALGLDPVFGALLNPTGGMVGSGDDAYEPGENDAVGYHGVFHDAGGYLLNYQKMGPGYDYLGQSILPKDWAGTGHASGIAWWMSHSQLDANFTATDFPDLVPFIPKSWGDELSTAANVVGEPAVRLIATTVDGGGTVIDGIGDVFAGDIAEGVGDIGSGLGTIASGVGRSVLDIFD